MRLVGATSVVHVALTNLENQVQRQGQPPQVLLFFSQHAAGSIKVVQAIFFQDHQKWCRQQIKKKCFFDKKNNWCRQNGARLCAAHCGSYHGSPAGSKYWAGPETSSHYHSDVMFFFSFHFYSHFCSLFFAYCFIVFTFVYILKYTILQKNFTLNFKNVSHV